MPQSLTLAHQSREQETDENAHTLQFQQGSGIVWRLLPQPVQQGIGRGLYLSSHACVSRLGREYRHGVHQCLCLQGAFQPSPAPPDDSFGLASESSSHIVWVLYKLLCPQLQGLGANKTTHKAFKRVV